MSVYVSNLVINQGATFTQKFELENVTSNSALELSGFTVFSNGIGTGLNATSRFTVVFIKIA